MLKSRIDKLTEKLCHNNLDAFLVTFLPHVRYVSGFKGTSGICLLTEKTQTLIIDARYSIQAQRDSPNWNLICAKNTLFDGLKESNLLKKQWRVGVDGNSIALAHYKSLKQLFPSIRFFPKVGFIEEIASVKDRGEISKIKKAIAISDTVFESVLKFIKPGVRESEIAAEITYLHYILGASGDAFRPIVASGLNGAMVHARASDKKLKKGEMVTLDFGCRVDGYNSDITRTIFIGKPNPKALKIYNIVLNALQTAIASAKAGISAKDLDWLVREKIRDAGYGNFFTHSLGHGIGIQIHEAPRISVRNPTLLKSGNVITLEPGIYIPNFGGVRIEDIVLIKQSGAEIFTKSPKEPIIL